MKRRLVDDIQIKGRWRGVIVNGGKGNIRETAFKNTCTAIGKAMLANAENGDADDVLPGLIPGVNEYKALAEDCGRNPDTALCTKAALGSMALLDPSGVTAVAASLIEKECTITPDSLGAAPEAPLPEEGVSDGSFNRCTPPAGRDDIDFTACDITAPGEECAVHCRADGRRTAKMTCPEQRSWWGSTTLTGNLPAHCLNWCTPPAGRDDIDFKACDITAPGQTCDVHCRTDGYRTATMTCPEHSTTALTPTTLTGNPAQCPCSPNADYQAIMTEGKGFGCLNTDSRMPNTGCVVVSKEPFATTHKGCYYCGTSGGELETINSYIGGAKVTGWEARKYFRSRWDRQISQKDRDDCNNAPAVQAEARRAQNQLTWAQANGERANYMNVPNPYAVDAHRRRRSYSSSGGYERGRRG